MKISERREYSSKSKPLSFKQDDTVSTAVKSMTEFNYGAVAIVNDDGTVAGIVSERDIMKRLVNQNKNPEKTKLSEIMTKDVRTATEDDLVVDWLRIMSNERFRHLPIVNDKKQLISMMSQGDFVSYTWPELIGDVKAKAVESWGVGHQVIMIVLAMLAYAFFVQVFL